MHRSDSYGHCSVAQRAWATCAAAAILHGRPAAREFHTRAKLPFQSARSHGLSRFRVRPSHPLGPLVWGLVRRTLSLPFFAGRFEGVANALALAVSVLWVLHPLQSEAVMYVTQRTELLVSFCYLSTLYASLRYWQAELQPARGTWLILAMLACAAGMASKEIMVSAPVIVLAYERTFIAGSFRRAWRNSWPLYVCLAATGLILAALNFSGPRSHSTGFGSGVPAYVWWFTEAKVLLLYLRLAVWPWPLVIHYEYDYLESLAAAWPWVAQAAGIGLVAAILFWRRTAIGFALIFMFAILSPTLVVPIVTEVAAERRMYLPLAALVAIAVVGAYRVLARLADSPGQGNDNRGTACLATCSNASGLRGHCNRGGCSCHAAGDGLQRTIAALARCACPSTQ